MWVVRHANIACGITRHGLKVGFIGRVSDDQFGDFVVEYFQNKGLIRLKLEDVNMEKIRIDVY